MEPLDGVILFLAGFGQVFLMAFQSRCINSGRLFTASLNSFLIAISQGAVWSKVAPVGGLSVEALVYGLSGAVAVPFAMMLHARMFR